jgi:hypothetical protein
MMLADKHAVRYMKVMTCNNGASPLGTGLWEGVPLRAVFWIARPVENIRRIFYYGYHNDDPKQLFQSSLPIGRVLEDPPGEHPVMLCYKLNGKWLSGKRGGPVRMLVPDAYGFKSVKWLQHVAVSNLFHANDTYARGNNDIDSKMKSFTRFIYTPSSAKLSQPIPVTGLAQVGVSGLSKVQCSLQPQDAEPRPEDPYFTRSDWKDAEVLPPPKRWGGDLPGNMISEVPRQFDPATGQPHKWPMRYSIVHWAMVLKNIRPGKYFLRCRSIDSNGIAQPMPRPFPKSGRNSIQQMPIVVEA